MSTLFKIGKTKYHRVNELMKLYPDFFEDCQTPKLVIKNKDLDSSDYVFAKLIDNKWTKFDGKDQKGAKLFVTGKWVECNIKHAPDVIELDKSEKFKDRKGNIVEIEVRGAKKSSECFFCMEDIANVFDLGNIQVIICSDSDYYVAGDHYKYFYVDNGGNKFVKKMYLTLKGFSKMANIVMISQKKTNMSRAIFKSLKLFDNTDGIEKCAVNDCAGYTYCITSPIINAVKIGFWRSNIPKLIARYRTAYGAEIKCHYVFSNDACLLEHQCHSEFREYRLSGELFEKEKLDDYVNYLNGYKIDIDETIICKGKRKPRTKKPAEKNTVEIPTPFEQFIVDINGRKFDVDLLIEKYHNNALPL